MPDSTTESAAPNPDNLGPVNENDQQEDTQKTQPKRQNFSARRAAFYRPSTKPADSSAKPSASARARDKAGLAMQASKAASGSTVEKAKFAAKLAKGKSKNKMLIWLFAGSTGLIFLLFGGLILVAFLFSGNNNYFASEFSSSCTTLQGNTNAEMIWNYYRSAGLSKEQTAGILGNYDVETGSSFDPMQQQGGGGPGRGIAQWETPGRWDTLLKYAEARNIDPYVLQTQLDFSMFEMTGSPGAPGMTGGNYKGAYDALIASSSVKDATIAFGGKYEIFKGSDGGESAYAERIKRANDAYTLFSDLPVPAASSSSCTAAGIDIVGDPYTSSVDVACYSQTVDLGIHDAYVSGTKIDMRLCGLPNLPSSSAESTPGSIYYIDGAKGMGIVNSRVSGAWYSLIDAAAQSGIHLGANSTFRTYAHQDAICGGTCDGTFAARPGYSSHQAGVAIDFRNMGTSAAAHDRNYTSCADRMTWSSAEYLWMRDNAAGFGFKQYFREAWHWDALNSASRCE